MAEPYDVVVSPHGAGVMISLAATIQASAVMPNFLITDYYVPTEEFAAEVMRPPFEVKDGYIELPTAPGLGVDLDERGARPPSVRAPPRARVAPVQRRGPIASTIGRSRPNSVPPAAPCSRIGPRPPSRAAGGPESVRRQCEERDVRAVPPKISARSASLFEANCFIVRCSEFP